MSSRQQRILVSLVVMLSIQVFSFSTRAQQQPPSTGGSPSAPALISPGDLLDITVYDTPEMTQEVRVEDDGEVQLSLIGPARVAGMTAQQAGVSIARQLEEHKQLLHPQVTVLVKEFASQGVSITGEVQHPGVYPVLTTRTVLDAISLAGGFTNLADSRVTIKHRSGKEERITVKLKGDDADAALDQNAVVYPGDLVVVPRAGLVYVLGDVGRPGGIVMQDNGKITIVQALAEAGGGNPTAALNGAVLLHKTDNGYTNQKIRLGDLVRGNAPDFALNSSDILFVPGSKLKYLANNTQSITSAVVGASVYHAF